MGLGMRQRQPGQHLVSAATVVKVQDLAAERVEHHEPGQRPGLNGGLDLQSHIGQRATAQATRAFKGDENRQGYGVGNVGQNRLSK